MQHALIGTDLQHAAQLLRQDEVVAIPTETVYGLAANAWSETAVQRIFQIKNRPLHNPLIVHLPSIALLDSVAESVPDMAYRLLEAFSPGPLTLLLLKKRIVPDLVTAGLPQVALRIPAHPLTRQLLQSLSFPLAAPSANPFGYISPTTAAHVARQLGDRVPYILDGGPCERGIESTVVGFEGETPILYRLGAISQAQLSEAAGESVAIRNHDEVRPVGPGMLAHHYSPTTRLLLSDNLESLLDRFKGQRIGAMVFQQPLAELPESQQFVLSPTGDLEEAARHLYDALHHLDALGLDVLLAETLPERGIGIAMNDRLRRAAAK